MHIVFGSLHSYFRRRLEDAMKDCDVFLGVSAKGAVKKGDKIQFDCSEEGIAVSCFGKSQGNVPSSELAASFCDVYLDEKSVSPTLLDCCLTECCAP